MTSINNSGIVNICSTCGCAAFAPLLNIVYTKATPNIVLKDMSTFDAGDSLKAVNVSVTDSQGNVKYSRITVTGAPGQQTLSLTGLNLDGDGINVHATIITAKGCIADLYLYKIAATITTDIGNTADELDKDVVQDTE